MYTHKCLYADHFLDDETELQKICYHFISKEMLLLLYFGQLFNMLVRFWGHL